MWIQTEMVCAIELTSVLQTRLAKKQGCAVVTIRTPIMTGCAIVKISALEEMIKMTTMETVSQIYVMYVLDLMMPLIWMEMVFQMVVISVW